MPIHEEREIDVPGFGKRRLNQDYDVPLAGGSSEDGQTVYADRDIDLAKTIDGTEYDFAIPLAIHELTERDLEDGGEDYTKAHATAEKAENDWVQANWGLQPDVYEGAWKDDIRRAAQKDEKTADAPPDIVSKPYDHPHSERARLMLREIERSQVPGNRGDALVPDAKRCFDSRCNGGEKNKVKRALRFDTFRLDATRRDQNGYLEADAAVTRTGVFVYHHPDGSITRELRHPSEVLKADSLATLKNRPVTLGHPADGKLTPRNTRRLAIGAAIGDVKHDGRIVSTKLQVTDEEAIDKITRADDPVREVSCGYDAEVTREDGTYNGEPYDHVQRNIVYNHVAIVPKGRAGREVGVRLDAGDAFQADDAEQEYVSKCMENPTKREEFPDEKQRAAVCYSMYRRGDKLDIQDSQANNAGNGDPDRRNAMSKTKIRLPAIQTAALKLDAVEFVFDGTTESAENVFDQMNARFDTAIEKIKELEGKNNSLQGKIDQLGDNGKISAAQVQSLAAERADVIGVAHYVGVKNYEHVETDQIKRLVVIKCSPASFKVDDLTPEYVQGRFDGIVQQIRNEKKGLQSLANLKNMVTVDAKKYGLDERADDESPRERFVKQTQEMWKKPGQTA